MHLLPWLVRLSSGLASSKVDSEVKACVGGGPRIVHVYTLSANFEKAPDWAVSTCTKQTIVRGMECTKEIPIDAVFKFTKVAVPSTA